jgi:hypothetical protein
VLGARLEVDVPREEIWGTRLVKRWSGSDSLCGLCLDCRGWRRRPVVALTCSERVISWATMHPPQRGARKISIKRTLACHSHLPNNQPVAEPERRVESRGFARAVRAENYNFPPAQIPLRKPFDFSPRRWSISRGFLARLLCPLRVRAKGSRDAVWLSDIRHSLSGAPIGFWG